MSSLEMHWKEVFMMTFTRFDLNQKPVDAKRILNSTILACFEALFYSGYNLAWT